MKLSYILNLIFVSSVVLPYQVNAAEDFVYGGSTLHIRTLASSCAACHGTNGNAVKANVVRSNVSEAKATFDAIPIAGLDKSYIEQCMLDFRSGVRPATVMHRHASGLTLDEITQLADYFSRQKPEQRAMPKPQKLKAVHDE